MSPRAPKAASAPGKVLLTGGYLVLDRQYSGLVFGLDARIHVHVAPVEAPYASAPIVVQSPQFIDTVWNYSHEQLPDSQGIKVTQSKGQPRVLDSRNPFVETALDYVLTYVRSLNLELEPFVIITIVADQSYYSQPVETSTHPDGQQQQRFRHFGTTLQDAHKTGLGSSAALVTALTAALLSFYLPSEQFNLANADQRFKLHNLAQAAHCAAQGKIGSGFDVAAAVFGSCSYTRFSPTVLAAVGNVGSEGFEQRLKQTVENTQKDQLWDEEVRTEGAVMPEGLRLVMCDVDCGSQTVGMVKKVLAWRKSDPDRASEVWNRLDSRNQAFSTLLRTKYMPKEELTRALQAIRSTIRDMSQAAGVPIEPESQKSLLDACSSIDGVIGGVVPGAGGDDAVVLLIEDRPKVLEEVRHLLSDWKIDRSASGMEAGKVKMLSVREDKQGARAQDNVEIYLPWVPL
ncbi:MAG: phosphomevalonate kinase [Vezdaea aestivalis]|nr:MAG: phosphomevalonate kinase [Vezdaea aestivalis]